eukprot:CAMPEP_0202896458 /NCGR_PEP_ID=MMETSP1392-20130828/5462_1 /ASSEMBLY_ACC=CAM_ASM_000868 /TAXON_ID=225041 /ORGANISM="Chlamydomonas chlamydogama, Strain SAG 11-48b" /LENGTH=492 /DNA_ID=CAMNT_0049581827 /DNA_START=127 /DNA_END=1605 /DNA_ORIENTATION=-
MASSTGPVLKGMLGSRPVIHADVGTMPFRSVFGCPRSANKPGRVYSNAPAVAERRTVPLPKEDLVNYLKSGCRPKSAWRIGTEHEKLAFNLKDNRRLSYDEIAMVLRKLESRFGWQPIMEGPYIIGVTQEGQSVTLEPGGQFELSGAPVETIHKTCAEVNSHLYQVKAIAEELGMGFLGVGFDPKWSVPDIPIMPKDRYNLMKAYMPTVGSMGLDMMFRTCTVQVNLDFESEQDMIEKFRIGLALQPIANALFANSPFKEGKPTGCLSTRGHVWTDVDKSRTGGLPFVFENNMSFERYVDYAMDVPMYFVYRDGGYVNALGQSWRDFMAGKLPALPGEYPTLADWANHLTTIFPEVRLKKFLEMRGADGGPWRMLCALPAFWVGLIYEPEAQRQALDLIADWTPAEREYLRVEVPRLGLRTPFRGKTVHDVAKQVINIARGGLERRGYDEAHFLKRLEVIVETGLSQADLLLDLYNSKWQRSVDPMFKEMMY